jgi:hypothetical protein
METVHHSRHWYTRRDGVIRGPFSVDEITRHFILGRICLDDELSQDQLVWMTANRYTDLLPVELQDLNSWDDYQQLVIARMQVDERKGERRCQPCSNHSGCHTERRTATERRDTDNDRLISQYLFGRPHSPGGHTATQKKLRPLLLTLLLATLVFAWLLPTQR